MAKNYVRENIPLSRFGVLVAQLESIVASVSQQSPDAILCFDLLSDLNTAIDEEPKESILLWQRKCEDALYSLLTLGARRPVRHLASVAMAKIIYKGDSISIYSRASSLQGFLSDGKKSEPLKVAGAAQCLGELYQYFGRRITSGLLETTIIAAKLMKFNEELVRQEALLMLQKALEGCGAGGAAAAYTEAYRLVTRSGIVDKSFVVRIAAAHCLKAFANIGGPCLGVGELDSSASYCVKALEDSTSSVRDAFAEALGSLLALGLNPEAQVQPRGKGPFPPAKKLEGGLHRHLTLPFSKANGHRVKEVRIGITLAWVFFLQAIRLKYRHPDSELQHYAVEIIEMLRTYTLIDAHALACVLYILRIGVTDLMTEPTQRGFLVFLGKQLESPEGSPSMKVAALRTLSYTLKTLGEVPLEFKEVIDNAIVGAVSHPSQLVRIEASLALHVVAEVDPTCVGGLISYGVTTLTALRENVSFEKGNNLIVELDSLHGQAAVLAALVSVSPTLTLGYPARLPRSVLEVSKQMLTESNRNPIASTIEQEAGWLLLSSLLSSIPKQELEEQVFDILALWATLFNGTPENEIKQIGDLTSRIRVWSAAIDSLASFIRCFISPNTLNSRILLQPVIFYLSSALSYVLLLQSKEFLHVKPVVDIFVISTLVAYQSLPDTMAYKSDHTRILQLCTYPYREASKWEESTCLRSLLDKRDAWLGPWIPGRDWFEDELRAFQGGKDGLMPKVWENEPFPQPETINKLLVNQMLLCFGIMFASQDSGEMILLLRMIEQCLKSGKKQAWHGASVTNICVGLLAGLKALVASRPQPLAPDMLNLAQSIFQSILAEGDICSSQRRASSEGLGLLARLGNDIFTARMTRSLLGDLSGVTDPSYAGSIAFALGCIHRNAGGMALSSLVPPTVSAVSSLAKSTIPALQIWSLHGLLLTIEAAGFSYVSHVQATLGLAMDILFSEENGLLDLQQGVGRLINAIVAVLGPELAPGSIFFSRCKAVIAEISSRQETATLLESVRFTQQLVLFAPRAVSVHSHVQTLLSTLSSRQPTLRHLAVSTLRHLIEKDVDSIINEEIEDRLFHILDEETDSEIGSLIRTTIMRLLLASCPTRPFHWIQICRKMVLATSVRQDIESNDSGSDPANVPNNNSGSTFGGDDENMVSSSAGAEQNSYAFEASNINREKHLRYLTRVFAAECLSHLPLAVGKNPAHFDLSLAKKQFYNGKTAGDWLVLHVQELISLAYQISTIQFENMRSIGLCLLSTVVDKFDMSPDPELPGHLLLEQYQAQLVSAVRTALSASSGPVLLEAGLQLATKIMTSGILGGDQVAVKRIFSLISQPLDEFNDLYYPSFAEWVSCKIKIRLLAAHASLKCYTFTFLRRHHGGVPDEYLALLPLFSKSSRILGKYWTLFLKDYSYVCLCLNLKKNWKPWLDGIQSPTVSSVLQPTFDEAWPVVLQALALDAVPVNVDGNSKLASVDASTNTLISGYSMVELTLEEYQFLWGFALLVLFQQLPALSRQIIPVSSDKAIHEGGSPAEDTNSMSLKSYEIVLPVFQFLSTQRFFIAGFVTLDICQELLQIFSYFIYMDNSWKGLAMSVLSQIVHNCPDDFLEAEGFVCLTVELLLAYIFDILRSSRATSSDLSKCEDLISASFITTKTLVRRLESKMQKHSKSTIFALLLMGYKCIREASTELCFSTIHDFVKFSKPSLKKLVNDCSKQGDDSSSHLRVVVGTCLNLVGDLTEDCIRGIHLLENRKSELCKLLQLKLSFSVEETILLVKLAYEIRSPEESEDSDVTFITFLKYAIKHIQLLLNDSNLQVQAIGLQVLKTMVQRGSNTGDQDFLLSFSGELITDIFTILQTTLERPRCKELTAVAGECLRFIALLQALSKAEDCQRGLMNLLLKAIVMVFTATENDSPEEGNDIRTIALKLVSQLAQIPSSASHFKDVLLSMPVNQRQQLQDAIRASVTTDNNPKNVKPGMTFEIKLPVPKVLEQPAMTMQSTIERKVEHLPQPTAPIHSDHENVEEDDDDWDAFQSFPASMNVAGADSVVDETAEESHLAERSVSRISNGSSDHQESSTSDVANDEQKVNDVEYQEFVKDDMISGSVGETERTEGTDEFETKDDVSNSVDIQNQKTVEDMNPGQESKENAISVDIKPTEDAEGQTPTNSVENYEQESSGIDIDVEVSPQDHVLSADIISNKDTEQSQSSSGGDIELSMEDSHDALDQRVSEKEGSGELNVVGDYEEKTDSSDDHNSPILSTKASPKDEQEGLVDTPGDHNSAGLSGTSPGKESLSCETESGGHDTADREQQRKDEN